MDFLVSFQPVMFAVSMITMNMGSRHLFAEISPLQERVFTRPLGKLLITFCIFFVYTKDIMLAIILSAFFTLTIRGIMNERRKFNLITQDHAYDTYQANKAKRMAITTNT